MTIRKVVFVVLVILHTFFIFFFLDSTLLPAIDLSFQGTSPVVYASLTERQLQGLVRFAPLPFASSSRRILKIIFNFFPEMDFLNHPQFIYSDNKPWTGSKIHQNQMEKIKSRKQFRDFHIELEKQEYDRLNNYCLNADMKYSSVFRRSLRQFLDAEEKKQNIVN